MKCFMYILHVFGMISDVFDIQHSSNFFVLLFCCNEPSFYLIVVDKFSLSQPGLQGTTVPFRGVLTSRTPSSVIDEKNVESIFQMIRDSNIKMGLCHDAISFWRHPTEKPGQTVDVRVDSERIPLQAKE